MWLDTLGLFFIRRCYSFHGFYLKTIQHTLLWNRSTIRHPRFYLRTFRIAFSSSGFSVRLPSHQQTKETFEDVPTAGFYQKTVVPLCAC